MNCRLAIFDSDGTLADTLPWMRGVFNELAAEFGFRRVEEHEWERFRHLHGADLLHELGLPKWRLPQLVIRVRQRMAAHAGPLTPFPGVTAALSQLHAAGIRLAVVSSNTRANVERVLGPEASALIAHWNCGASMFGKASKLRAVVKASGIPAASAIYVGDEVRDAEAAHAAGIAFGAVAWGQHSLETMLPAQPALCFREVNDLAGKLLNSVPVGTPVR